MTTVQRRGASWVHRRSPADTPNTFVHTVCGLTFTQKMVCGIPQVTVTEATDEAITCPECAAAMDEETLARLRGAGVPPTVFDTTEAQALDHWSGPHVEVLVTIPADGTPSVVQAFCDGREVPVNFLRTEVVDPARGWTLADWQEATRDLTSDSQLSAGFREAVITERDTAVREDRKVGGRMIVGEDAALYSLGERAGGREADVRA